MNLSELKAAFQSFGCQKTYIKILAPNDNSKNQVYLAGSFDILNVFPLHKIISDNSGDWKRDRFKASLKFSWIREDKKLYPAPKATLILYPKYPEVRFSGFLARCAKPPSDLMAVRLANRLLFLAPTKKGEIIGYVAAPDSEIAREFINLSIQEKYGVFYVLNLTKQVANNKIELINQLTRISNLGWIDSKRLNKDGNIVSCNSTNCGGCTLEAELGIPSNPHSIPDYLGWEIKQFGVRNFQRLNSAVITLMTPEPTGGVYKENGVEFFIRTYGYDDLMGRVDRINFGGAHKIGIKHKRTNLTLKLIGFDRESGKIRNTNGKIVLLDENGIETASWSFASLLEHWNRKHNQACYVPSMILREPIRKYKYSPKILLGIGTDFQLFLKEMDKGDIYYDPGIKMENASKKPKIKRRSQFRIKSGFLRELYKVNQEIILVSE